jgi:hypothetical protein
MTSPTILAQIRQQRAHPSFIGVPTEEMQLDLSWIRQCRRDTLDDPLLAESTRRRTLEYLDAKAAPIVRELQRRHEQHTRYAGSLHGDPWPGPERYQKLLDLAAQLKHAVPLHEFVRLAVPGAHVQPSGRNWRARCPLHEDKTPSLVVYQDGHFHCFSCGEHGDVFSMIGIVDNLERFSDQVLGLAGWHGLAVRL